MLLYNSNAFNLTHTFNSADFYRECEILNKIDICASNNIWVLQHCLLVFSEIAFHHRGMKTTCAYDFIYKFIAHYLTFRVKILLLILITYYEAVQ